VLAVVLSFSAAACAWRQNLAAREVRAADGGGLEEAVVPASAVADAPAPPGDSIFFLSGSSELSEESRNTLRRQADWLQQHPDAMVRVEGNCDAVERPTADAALALGVLRAIAAKDHLIELGVAAERIDIQSNGRDRPRDPRGTEVAHAVNRSVVTVILSAQPGRDLTEDAPET
jgi:peptidoglycan-associated lipoprotein